MSIITYTKKELGSYTCRLDLDQVFNNSNERVRFESKWLDFMHSDTWNSKVFYKDKNIIQYYHKSWIPEKPSRKPKLLLLAGNPAPHSTYKSVCFGQENNQGEHRFWKVLRESNILEINSRLDGIKTRFFDEEYTSDFQVGIEVLFSFPTPASHKLWSGVQGIKKLFGQKAFEKIYLEEQARLRFVIQNYLNNGGTIVTFQRDVFESISNTKYSYQNVLKGETVVKLGSVTIYAAPPTRLVYSQSMKDVLQKVNSIAQHG